jgi:hypothetical protein
VIGDVNRRQDVRTWAREVSDALVRCRTDLARTPLARLMAALPEDPHVLELRRWAAASELRWPAERKEVVISPRPPPLTDHIDLVMFHVEMPVSPSGIHDRVDYLRMASLSFEAAATRAPRSRRIFLTDSKTNVPDMLGADEVIRYPIDHDRLMYERMRVQGLYLATRAAERATVFIDADVVPNRDPASIFSEDFDVGLTFRPDWPDKPFNGGLIFVGPGQAGTAFFREALCSYDLLASDPRLTPLFRNDLRSWWGDQISLVLMVSYRQLAKHGYASLSINGTRIRFFSCDEYNFTPEPTRSYSDECLSARYFIHFKGNRKLLQERYLEQMRARAP